MQKTFYNSISHLLGGFFPLVMFLVLSPFLQLRLGEDMFGVLLLLTSLINIGTVIDFGFGKAIVKFISEYYHTDKEKDLDHVINLSFIVFAIIGMLGLILIFVFSNFISTKLLKIPIDLQGYIVISLRLSGLVFFLNMLASAIGSIFYALNKYILINSVNIILNIIYTCLVLLFLSFGIKLNGLILLNMLISVLSILVFIILIKRFLPKFSIRPIGFIKKHVVDLTHRKFSGEGRNNITSFKFLSFSFYSFTHKIFLIATYHIDRLIIASTLGIGLVPFYAVPIQIIIALIKPLGRMTEVIIPIASELSAKGDWDQLKRKYLKASRLLCVLSTSLFMPVVLFGNQIIYFWMGQVFANKAQFVIILTGLAYYIISFTGVISLIIDGVGRPKVNTVFVIIYTFLILAFIFPLTKKYGINGAALSMLFASFYVPGMLFYCNKKILKVEMGEYVKSVYKPIIIAVVMGCFYYVFNIHSKTVFDLVLVFVYSMVTYYLFCYLFKAIKKDEISLIRSLIFPVRL
jgi:O-antigen/teichoic acid export membrane protein